ncbi:MAG: hypothetical protein FWG93_00585 [Oscillospiraceae bacterium]|nr:hypothetical protein [Oscillospiraceae bacterium]
MPIVDTVLCDFDGDGVPETAVIRCALDYSQYNHTRQYKRHGQTVLYSGPDVTVELTCGGVEYSESLDEIVIAGYLGAEAMDIDGDGGQELVIYADTGGTGGCVSIAVLTWSEGTVKQVSSDIHPWGFSAAGTLLPDFQAEIAVGETGFTQTIPLGSDKPGPGLIYESETGLLRWESGRLYEEAAIEVYGAGDWRIAPERGTVTLAQDIRFASSTPIGVLVSELRFSKNGYEVISQSVTDRDGLNGE